MLIEELYAGVDIGSTAVRIGLLNTLGELVYTESRPIDHHFGKENNKFVTQSSDQIWSAFLDCYETLLNGISHNEKVVSISCCATCSMVVMKRVDKGLVPFPVDYGFKNKDQNVVFWMDSRAGAQTDYINSVLKEDEVSKFCGGAFIEEMAIPKAKYIIDNVSKEDLPDIVLFDLHDFITFKIGNIGQEAHVISNRDFPIAFDGALKGWSKQFLNKVGLGPLALNNFQGIGRLESNESKSFLHLPLAGQRIGTGDDDISISQGVIDSYGGWIGSCGKQIKGTLTMVAGTSTCFLVGHESFKTVPGVWGPFSGIFENIRVSEGGCSTTGKLIDHLFEIHPSTRQIEGNRYEALENLIKQHEISTGEDIHYSMRSIYLYGDLSGNRTPFCDSELRGVFFGESTDTSIKDLMFKYVAVLEFLAFQTKQILELLSDHEVHKIVMCGSQAKNKRLVQLIANVTQLPVETNSSDPELSGVRGAAYLGLSGYNNLPLQDIINKYNKEGVITRPEKVSSLLNIKYKIMLDIVERQRTYNSWVKEAI